MSIITIIENTDEARDSYGHRWRSEVYELSVEEIRSLLNGKCLATEVNDEYSIFFVKKEEVIRA